VRVETGLGNRREGLQQSAVGEKVCAVHRREAQWEKGMEGSWGVVRLHETTRFRQPNRWRGIGGSSERKGLPAVCWAQEAKVGKVVPMVNARGGGVPHL